MTAAVRRLSLETGRGWLGWIVPASMALHVLAIAGLPDPPHALHSSPPVLIVLTDPPPPSPPPREEEPAQDLSAGSARVAARAMLTAARANASPREPAASTSRPVDDSPLDFSNTVMSNDGLEVPIGSSSVGVGVAARGTPPAAAAPLPALVAPSGPRLVAARDLSRQPRAPGLDVALEQHYPAEARRAGISGKAVLRVRILPDGRVGAVQRVEESRGGFAEACEKTVRSARWEPPIDREGAPVATEITYTCRFEIRG